MSEARDAPPQEGGSGGLLDMMCSVTETLAQIIKKQATEIERAKVERSVCEELREVQKAADAQLDRIERKLRRA